MKSKALKCVLSCLVIIFTLSLVIAPSNLIGAEEVARTPRKTEAVFGLLAADGAVDSLYVINQFEKLVSPAQDFGEYSDVKSLTDLELSYQNGAVSLPQSDSRFWYQGNLKSKDIPWKFAFHYRLDGREVQPTELAGKEGKLSITFSVEKKADYQLSSEADNYYDHYAVQVRIPFNPELSREISAPNAVVAIEGKDIATTYTLLSATPERSYTLTAEIKDFHMDRIRISAVPLNFLSKLPETENFTAPIADLEAGITELAKGTSDLLRAQDPLVQGSSDLQFAGHQLQTGNRQLLAGMRLYAEKLQQLTNALPSVASGVGDLSDGITKLHSGMSDYGENLRKAAEAAPRLQEANNSFASALTKLSQSINLEDTDNSLDTLLAEYGKLEQGLKNYTEGVSGALKAVVALKPTLRSLSEQLKQMSGAVDVPLVAAAWCERLGIDPAKLNDEDVAKAVNALVEQGQARYRDAQTIAAVSEFLAQVISSSSENNGETTQDPEQVGRQLLNGMAEMRKALETLAAKLSTGQKDLITLRYGISELSQKYGEYATRMSTYLQSIPALHEGYDQQLLTASSQLSSGAQKFQDKLIGIGPAGAQLVEGFGELTNNFDQLTKSQLQYAGGVEDLTAGFRKYLYGVSKLAGGNQTLAEQTNGMTQRVEAEIAKQLKPYQQTDYRPASFTSAKNKDVENVQFVFFVPEIK